MLPNLASLSLHCPSCSVAPTGVTRDRFSIFLPGVNLKDEQPEPEIDDDDKQCKICNELFAHPSKGFVETDGPPGRLQNELNDLWIANPRDPEAIATKQQELDEAIDVALPGLRTADLERFQVELLIPGCGHQFHLKCLKGWINAPDPDGEAADEDRRKQCPICSVPIDAEIVRKLSIDPRRNVRAREDDGDDVRFAPRSPDYTPEFDWQALVTNEDGRLFSEEHRVIREWADQVHTLGMAVSEAIAERFRRDESFEWDAEAPISHRMTRLPFSKAWEILLGRIELLCADAFMPDLAAIVRGGNPFNLRESGMAYWPYEIFENLPTGEPSEEGAVPRSVKIILESWRSALDDSIFDVWNLLALYRYPDTSPPSPMNVQVQTALSAFLWHFTGQMIPMRGGSHSARFLLMLTTEWYRTRDLARTQYRRAPNPALSTGEYRRIMDDAPPTSLRYTYMPAYIDLIVGVRLTLKGLIDELAQYRQGGDFSTIPYGSSGLAANVWGALDGLETFVELKVASYRNEGQFIGYFPDIPTDNNDALLRFFMSFFDFHREYTEAQNPLMPPDPIQGLIMDLLKAMAVPYEPDDSGDTPDDRPAFDWPLSAYRYDADFNIVKRTVSPQYSPTSPQYSLTSPQYSPTSPQYAP